MSEKEKNKDGKTVICVLLPVCVEMETDFFLNLLQRFAIGRASTDDPQFDAIKAGMSSDTLYIKSNDLLVNWKELTSDSQRIRQMKMLGVWTMYNYPLLGKKLFGESWNAPENKRVEVIGDSVKSADAVNEVIFRKMKLRVIELNVSFSTLGKLKHFVRVPNDIGKFNGIQISQCIKSFEIDDAVIENSWKVLKFGSIVNDKQPTVQRKKTQRQIEQGVNIGGSQLLHVAKRLRLDGTTGVESGEKESRNVDGSRLKHSAEASRIDTIEKSTIESIRKEVFEMRKEMGDLSKLYHPEGHNTECPETENVVSRKNKEISQLKSDAEKLVNENEMLNGLIERNTNLAHALQNGLDSSVKMNGMLENQIQVLTKQLSVAEKVRLEMSEENAKLERELLQSKNCAASVDAQNQIQDLTRCLSETDKLNLELFEKNVKLERDLIDSQHHAVTIEGNLESRIQDLTQKLSQVECDLLESKNCAASVDAQNQIQNLMEQLSESQKHNHELYNKHMKLERDFIDSIYTATTHEANLESRIQDFTKKLSEVERDLFESKNSAASVESSLQNEIQNLVKCLSETEKRSHELYNKNLKIDRDLVDSKHHASNTVSYLQSRIQDLTQKLSEAENKKLELSKKIRKLEVELIEASKLKDDLISLKDNANKIVAQFRNQIQEFETNLQEAKKKESLLITKNEKLEEELKGWERKGKELESVEALDKPEHPNLEIEDENSKDENSKDENSEDENSEDENSEDENSEDEDGDESEEDPIVKKFRKNLKIVEFGWIKFFETKNCIACLGFRYPPDKDGIQRAQKILRDGYPCSIINEYVNFDPHFPDNEKDKACLRMLKKFNGRFKTSFK